MCLFLLSYFKHYMFRLQHLTAIFRCFCNPRFKYTELKICRKFVYLPDSSCRCTLTLKILSSAILIRGETPVRSVWLHRTSGRGQAERALLITAQTAQLRLGLQLAKCLSVSDKSSHRHLQLNGLNMTSHNCFTYVISFGTDRPVPLLSNPFL